MKTLRKSTTHPAKKSATPLIPSGFEGRLVPICSQCNRIRLSGMDPRVQESWVKPGFDPYADPTMRLSHGLCPSCMHKLYPNLTSVSHLH